MHGRSIFTILATLSILAAPLVAAEWRGRGFYEPDTARDVADGMIWTDPDTDLAGSKVYFSAFSGLYVATPNPNSAALGSNVMAYPSNMHALLGVWKDCNADGYVGTPEGVILDYRAELLRDTTICPPTPGQLLVHNDAEWVRELLVIGPDVVEGNTAHTYDWNIDDPTARIWGDWGLPEDAARASCPLNPRPQGTYQSTGGFLRYSDCLASWRVTGAINSAAETTGIDDASGQQVSFSDAPKERPDQSASILNRPNPWGQERDDAYVTAFDCSEPAKVHDDTGMTHVSVQDPTGGQLSGPKSVGGVTTVTIFGADGRRNVANATDENYDLFVAGSPGAVDVNPGGSAAGTVNETTEAQAATGSCDREDDAGGATAGQVYELDEGVLEGTVAKRTKTDVWYEYAESGGCEGTVEATEPVECGSLLNGPIAFGASGASYQFWTNSWYAQPGYAASRNPYVNRDDLTPWGGVHYTAYAWVDPIVGSVPGEIGTYGSHHCLGTTEITGGWDCDGAAWWLGPDGKKLTSPHADYQITPGRAYDLMDVDCYDASPAKGAPGLSGALAAPCAR